MNFDFKALLHQYPQNLLIAALFGMAVMWLLSRSSRRATLEQERTHHARQLEQMRGEYLEELGGHQHTIESLRGERDAITEKLGAAERSNVELGERAAQLPAERARYATLKSEYLANIARASNALKSRGQAFIKLQADHRDSERRYGELHQRWNEERGRYARIVTEKARRVADLEAQLESAIEEAEAAAEENTYSRQELEGMLVELREQLAKRENELAALRDGGVEHLPDQLSALRASLAARERELDQLHEREAAREATGDDPIALREALDQRDRELAALRAEAEHLRPAAERLHSLERRLQAALREQPEDSPEQLRALEIRLQQLDAELSRARADKHAELAHQAKAYQRQLNARADTIGRLNRQLQAAIEQR